MNDEVLDERVMRVMRDGMERSYERLHYELSARFGAAGKASAKLPEVRESMVRLANADKLFVTGKVMSGLRGPSPCFSAKRQRCLWNE